MERDPKGQLIVAVDTTDVNEAISLMEQLAGFVEHVKIGGQLGYSWGWKYANSIAANSGFSVFLDTKLHETKDTDRKIMAEIARYDTPPEFISAHIAKGESALKTLLIESGTVKVLGNTILTSLSPHECRESYGGEPLEKTLQFAKIAGRAGLAGVICSPKEIRAINKRPNGVSHLAKVAVGVRPNWSDYNDQIRGGTLHDAVLNDADYIVIGRPITDRDQYSKVGKTPLDAVLKIYEQIHEIRSNRPPQNTNPFL